jgi:hypothetical protein
MLKRFFDQNVTIEELLYDSWFLTKGYFLVRTVVFTLMHPPTW